LHPIRCRRATDEIEFIFVKMKEYGIANYISIAVAGNKLLGLIDFEILKAIDAKIGKYFQCVRALDIKIGHMVRLIEKSAGLPPGALLISPVREFGAHHRKGIRSYLRLTQQFNRTTNGS
jgi:hypothetical protein